MNVLFVINSKGPYSIHQAQIEMICALRNKGIQMLVAGCFSDAVATVLSDKEIEVFKIYPNSKIDISFIKNIKKIITEKDIDILHVLDGKALRSCLIAVKTEKLKIITYFGSVSLHWHDISSYLTYLHPRIDKIVCNSAYVFNHVRKQLFGRHKNKAVKIFKGYNSDWFDTIPVFDYTTLGIPKNSIVVTFAATNMKLKRIPDFIKSANYLTTNKQVHYVIMGKNTDNGNLDTYRNESLLKNNIHILGVQSNAISLIKGSDLYVQTSSSEGFGRAISEAMCVGKPIVMTDGGGCTELIDKESGVVVPVGNFKAIGKEISKIVNNNELRMKMGKKAKERMSQLYHIDTTVEDTYNLYLKTLQE